MRVDCGYHYAIQISNMTRQCSPPGKASKDTTNGGTRTANGVRIFVSLSVVVYTGAPLGESPVDGGGTGAARPAVPAARAPCRIFPLPFWRIPLKMKELVYFSCYDVVM